MPKSEPADHAGLLARIADALDRLAPPPVTAPDFDTAEAFVWQARPEAFLPVAKVSRQPLHLLKSVDRAAAQLLDNTRRFAKMCSRQPDLPKDSSNRPNASQTHVVRRCRRSALLRYEKFLPDRSKVGPCRRSLDACFQTRGCSRLRYYLGDLVPPNRSNEIRCCRRSSIAGRRKTVRWFA